MSESTELPTASPSHVPAERRAISIRSVVIGTIGVTAICTITPYNDYVINNSFLTGSYLPPALVLALLALIIVNGFLNKLLPGRALVRGEMGIITAMLLVACSVPGQGMMRNLIPLMVTFFRLGRDNEPIWRSFTALGLPAWLFAAPDIATGRGSDVVTYFYSRLPADGSIPWRAWMTPILAWGAFVVCFYTAIISLATLLWQQWAVNERLPFPLAQLGSMMIEPPAPNRALNKLLADRTFWITTLAVFVLQSLVALHKYQPQYFPDLTFTFDLGPNLTEPPWTYLIGEVKKSTLFFTFVGVTYFIQSRVGFSLWAIFLIEQFVAMAIKTTGADVPIEIWSDQHLGACAVFLVGTIWVGRGHWKTVIRQAIGIGQNRPGEANYASRARTFMLAATGMVVWLIVVGVGPFLAILFVGFIVAAHVIIARIVAETGLPFMRVMVTGGQILSNFPTTLVTSREMFFTGIATYFGPISTRESLLPSTLHGLQISQGDEPHTPSRRRAVVSVMAWALLVACGVSIVSSLWCYYTYALPLNPNATAMENTWGAIDLPKQYIATDLVAHDSGHYSPKPYNSGLQIALGGIITAILQFGSLRFAGWPLMPVAYLVSHTGYVRQAWWSIFIGWLAKVLVLRFGGASLFQRLKPAFVGLVIGEALATGFWLIVAIVLVWTNNQYQVVNFLPQ